MEFVFYCWNFPLLQTIIRGSSSQLNGYAPQEGRGISVARSNSLRQSSPPQRRRYVPDPAYPAFPEDHMPHDRSPHQDRPPPGYSPHPRDPNYDPYSRDYRPDPRYPQDRRDPRDQRDMRDPRDFQRDPRDMRDPRDYPNRGPPGPMPGQNYRDGPYDHDQRSHNDSFDRRGPNDSFDRRQGPNDSYDRRGPNDSLDRRGHNDSFDRRNPNDSFDRDPYRQREMDMGHHPPHNAKYGQNAPPGGRSPPRHPDDFRHNQIANGNMMNQGTLPRQHPGSHPDMPGYNKNPAGPQYDRVSH